MTIKNKIYFWIPAFFIVGAAIAQTDNNPARNVFRKVESSIVIVEAGGSTKKSQGSGVVIGNGYLSNSKSSWIVTNAHVIGNNGDAEIKVGKSTFKGTVEYKNTKTDLAIVFVEDEELRAVARRYAASPANIGDRVYAIGAPKGLEKTITDGIISSLRSEGKVQYIQTSAPISPGSSGGGLFSELGDLIGVTTFKIVGGESLNFAVSIEHAYEIEQSVAAAKMIRTASFIVNGGKQMDLGDGFVDWLASENSETGRKNISIFNEVGAKFRNGTYKTGSDEYMHALADIGRLYLLNADPRRPAQSRGDEVQKLDPIVSLVCDMQYQTGRKDRLVVKIDFNKKLVDGFPAKFHENYIEYDWSTSSGTTFYHTLDRVSSYLKIHTISQPGFGGGPCRRVEERAF